MMQGLLLNKGFHLKINKSISCGMDAEQPLSEKISQRNIKRDEKQHKKF